MGTRSMLAAGAAALVPGAVACGQVFSWEWSPGDPGNYSHSDGGGALERVTGRYRADDQRLRWSTTFADQRTKGLTLALNNGPDPKGHAGELALIFLDACDPGDLKLTAYAYNGKNLTDSWRDGDGNAAGDQDPDRITSSFVRSDWIHELSVRDHDGKRTFTFEIDAGVLAEHDPRYGNGQDWYGMGFAERLGLWMHTYENLETSYVDGYLGAWNAGGEGFLDGSGFRTEVMPLPPAAWLGLAGLGGAWVITRRRAPSR